MINIEKENKQLKEVAKIAADVSFKLFEQVYNLKAENERLKLQLAEIGKSWEEIQRLRKEKIIKLTEGNGNLIINRNTVENKLRDTESRLISIQKANTHNLVLLQRRNNALEEIRANIQNWINSPWSCFNCRNNMDERLTEIKNKINEVLNDT